MKRIGFHAVIILRRDISVFESIYQLPIVVFHTDYIIFRVRHDRCSATIFLRNSDKINEKNEPAKTGSFFCRLDRWKAD